MESSFHNLDAAGFLEIWQHFDADGENSLVLRYISCLQKVSMNAVYRECVKALNAQTEAEEFAGIRGWNLTLIDLWGELTKPTGAVLTDNGYIEGKELDDFFRHMMKRLGPKVSSSIGDA